MRKRAVGLKLIFVSKFEHESINKEIEEFFARVDEGNDSNIKFVSYMEDDEINSTIGTIINKYKS